MTIVRVTAGRRGHALFASCPGIPGRVISVVFASKYPQKSRSFRGGSRFLATPSSSVTRVFPVPALGCSGSAHALRFQLPFRQNRFATDSALEGIGFEPSVPPSSIGHPDVLHRFPNGSRGNWHTAGNQLSVGCTSYADQDQPDSLQARCERVFGRSGVPCSTARVCRTSRRIFLQKWGAAHRHTWHTDFADRSRNLSRALLEAQISNRFNRLGLYLRSDAGPVT